MDTEEGAATALINSLCLPGRQAVNWLNPSMNPPSCFKRIIVAPFAIVRVFIYVLCYLAVCSCSSCIADLQFFKVHRTEDTTSVNGSI